MIELNKEQYGLIIQELIEGKCRYRNNLIEAKSIPYPTKLINEAIVYWEQQIEENENLIKHLKDQFSFIE